MVVRPTRRAQPYRKGRKRPRGRTLVNMTRGQPAGKPHPLHRQRRSARRAARRRKHLRALYSASR